MQPLRRSALVNAVATAGIIAAVACNAEVVGPEFSNEDGQLLDASKMAVLRARGSGCTFSIEDPANAGKRAIAAYGVNSPLRLPELRRHPITGKPTGRIARARVAPTGSDTVTAECTVPNDMSALNFAAVLAEAGSRGVWKGIERALRSAPLVANRKLETLSREGRQFNLELRADADSSGFSPPANRSVTFWCEGYWASSKGKTTRPRANRNFDIICTCSTTNGVNWNCFMNFQFYSHTFQVEEIYSDPWVDCDDVGCGGSDGPSGDWISVSATPTVVP